MRRFRFLGSVALAPLVMCGFTTGAFAKEGDAIRIEEVVVTAQRRKENIQDVPLSVTALSSELMDRAPVHNLADIQYYAPGVNISGRNNSGVIAIRGIGFDMFTAGAEGSVAVHTDGVYASRPMVALTGLYDVERIEIARGPQGTLYGRNATGGAINIITRRPTDELSGYIDASYGNYNSTVLSGAISGPITDKLRFRVAVKKDDHGGYGVNQFKFSPGGRKREVDTYHTIGLRGKLEFKPSDRIDILFMAERFDENDTQGSSSIHSIGCLDPVCNAFAPENRPAPGPYLLPGNLRDVNQDVQPLNKQSHSLYSLTGVFDLGFADLKSITGYRKGSSYFLWDFDGTAEPGTFITREEDYESWSQEFQLTGGGERLDWVLGTYYFHEKNNARAKAHFPLFFDPILTNYFQGGILKTNAYAAFGDVTLHLTDRLSIIGGARYSYETKKIEDEKFYVRGPSSLIGRVAAPTAEIPCVVCRGLPNKVDFTNVSPKAGITFDVGDDKMLYFTFQEGFKSGGFTMGGIAPAFLPEGVRSYEVGLKSIWANGRVLINLDGFHYDYSNLQVGYLPPNSVSTQVGNAGSAKGDGVEFEGRWLVTDNFTIDANAAYVYARFTDYDAPPDNALNVSSARNLKGNLLSNSPKWTGRLGLQYDVPAFGGELSLRADVFASSRSYFTPYNDVPNSQKAYVMDKTSIRWTSPNETWHASAYVSNIADQTILMSAGVRSATVGRYVGVDLSPPRLYGVAVGANF